MNFREIPSHVLQKVCMYFTYKTRWGCERHHIMNRKVDIEAPGTPTPPLRSQSSQFLQRSPLSFSWLPTSSTARYNHWKVQDWLQGLTSQYLHSSEGQLMVLCIYMSVTENVMFCPSFLWNPLRATIWLCKSEGIFRLNRLTPVDCSQHPMPDA